MKGRETYLWFLTTSHPYGHGLVSSFFFPCVYLSYADVELLCDITRADCLKTSGVDPSQCLISSLKHHPYHYLKSRTACTRLAVTFEVEK